MNTSDVSNVAKRAFDAYVDVKITTYILTQALNSVSNKVITGIYSAHRFYPLGSTETEKPLSPIGCCRVLGKRMAREQV
jgi:hypothetical protein